MKARKINIQHRIRPTSGDVTPNRQSAIGESGFAQLEALEDRRLLSSMGIVSTGGSTSAYSGYETADSASTFNWMGTLTLWGTSGNDSINVERSNGYVNGYVNGFFFDSRPDWAIKSVVVHGGDGNDTITVNDNVGTRSWLYGEGGDDTFVSARWTPEDFYGGPGNDTVSYANRLMALHVTIDNARDDGESCSPNYCEVQSWGADNVHTDIEVVLGGSNDDYLESPWYNATLVGNKGNDTLIGGWGNDSLSGGDGDDYLSGADGNDTLMAGWGRDTLFGGNGWDDADYRDRWAPLTITLDWFANDGQQGENDMVFPDIEAVWGGHADDRIVGTDGDNALFGMQGDDSLIGLGGNDSLYGYVGNDVLVGGHGADYLDGEDGNDTLVAVGGSQADTLYGNAGADAFWADSESTEQIDADGFEYATGRVNRIASFMTYHFDNGGDVPVGRDPNGENLADPVADPNDGFAWYASFSSNPLFALGGPVQDDIDQNALGDCYYLATLASIARTNADRIRQSVVELGDGSFAVRFYKNNQPVYIRVDGDLPVNNMNGLIYGGLGTQSSIWGAIMEKAFAYFRNNNSNYASIEGGWSDEAYRVLGQSSSAVSTFFMQADAIMDHILNELLAGKSVTVSTPGNGNFLVGNHVYSVDTIYWDANGVRHIKLRNPWGFYNDLTATQLAASIEQVDSAYV